jgi:hypothetical protein
MDDKIEELDNSVKDKEKNIKKIWLGHHQKINSMNHEYRRRKDPN